MKISELTEAGVGKITKQNTTVDVKPGETERQAAKLFPMNKGGKPQPLHAKAAKNTTPNKLFNLGITENMSMTGTARRRLERKKGLKIGSPEWFKHWFDLPYLREGYKLQLERGSEMDVLHIIDTDTGHRTEVRGKAGYEIKHDPSDPLHQLLDKIGKSANISELINGEPTGINPRHPDSVKAKAATDVAFNEVTKDELISQSQARKQRMFVDAMLTAMHRLVQSKGDQQSLGGYAFSIAKSFGFDPRQLLDLYKERYGVVEDVTQSQLDQLENVLDRVFGQLGIDVEFTRHFLDRVNDARNRKPITIQELAMLFKKEFQRWGKPIAQLGPDQEAVMKDLESDINVPFVLKWDKDNNELDMIAKTVMRKKDFRTTNKEFPVESITESSDLVDEFLKSTGQKFSKRDTCGPACIDFISWARQKGIELKRVRGEFVADQVVHAKADFTPEMKQEFMQSGLNWNSAKDRKAWIEQSEYAEEWQRVPHYWTVDKDGNIHDPSGYQQLVKTGLASDLDPSRYIPEGVKENTPGTIANKINWAGKNKTPAKPASQQQPKDNQERDAWWQLLKQRVMGEDKDYMRGHCHEWALKDIEKHPERKLYARIGVHYEDDIEEVDHVFTVDPKTGKAYDVRGEFATADALLADHDFGADEVFVDEISRDDIDHFCSIGELKPLDENFADGKVKGKSRPGRVKRAGASCKGSVSELRRKAKNSSGEKQKMYHWCANMKSGRKKTK